MAENARAGGALLDRCDLGKLHDEHREYGRKFPLFAAGLLANLLAGLARDRKPPDAWQHAMALCFTDLPEEAAPVLAEEYAALTSAFVDAGVTTRASLDLLLPQTTYERLLGAAQRPRGRTDCGALCGQREAEQLAADGERLPPSAGELWLTALDS